MASFNRVILMGNLTRDPELRTLPNSDTSVCDFALAVNRKWRDADGGDHDEVLFIDCSAFGRTGQTIGESLTKGRPIHIEGRLKFEQWEQEDGQRRSKIRVVVEQFRFVDAKPGSGNGTRNGNSQPAGRKAGKRSNTGNGRSNRTTRSNVVEGELVGAGQEIPI
jgi:single-strand DNA-binding protein